MTTAVSALSLSDEHARMGKISNNLETHGEEEVTAFAITYELMLPEEQLDGFMGKYFHRSLYNTDKTNLQVPVDGFRRCKPLELEEVYEGVTVTIGDSTSEVEFKDCRASKFVLEPQVGGLTKLKVQVYLRPGIGDENLWLQEIQHTEVSITIADGKIAKKKNPAQQSLPLEPPKVTPETDAKLDDAIGRPDPVESKGGDAIDAELHARHPELADETMGADAPADGEDLSQFEEGTAAQLAAFHARPGDVIDGRSERVKYQDAQRERDEETV